MRSRKRNNYRTIKNYAQIYLFTFYLTSFKRNPWILNFLIPWIVEFNATVWRFETSEFTDVRCRCQINRVCQQKYVEKFIDVTSYGASKWKISLKKIKTFVNGRWPLNSCKWAKFNLRPWPLTFGQNSLKHPEMWFLARVRMYVCVRVRIYLIINFSNHDIRYNTEAVTSLYYLQFSCTLMPNLRFYGIVNFLNNVYGSSLALS